MENMEKPLSKKAIKEKKAEYRAAKAERDENGPVSGFKESDMNVMARMYEDKPEVVPSPEQVAYNTLRDLNDSAEIGIFGPEAEYDDGYREKLLKLQEEKSLELYQAKEIMDWRYPQTEEIAESKEFEIDKKARLLKRKDGLTMSQARKKAERQLEKELLRDLKQNSPLAELKRSVEPKDSGDKSVKPEKDIDLWEELEKDPELFKDEMVRIAKSIAEKINDLKDLGDSESDDTDEKEYRELLHEEIRQSKVELDEYLDHFKDITTASDAEKAIVMQQLREIIEAAMNLDDDDDDDSTPPPTPNPDDKPTQKMDTQDKQKISDQKKKILEDIDKADSISDKNHRADALASIARRYKSEQGFEEIAIEAADRIKKSTQHGFVKSRLLARTKKLGEVHDMHDQLLGEIAEANKGSKFGIDAASRVDMPWYRNKLLQGQSQAAMGRLQALHTQGVEAHERGERTVSDKILNTLLDSDDIDMVTRARNLMRGWQSRKYNLRADIENLKITGDPEWISANGLRHFSARQQALYELAVSTGDESIASLISLPRKRRKAVDQIRKKQATS